MTVAELRERLDACNPDDIVEIHIVNGGRDNYLMLKDISSCDIEAVTFLDGGKLNEGQGTDGTAWGIP